ncbi:hypothetical protein QYE76_015804 [Lolium multiflorum]|uniref:Uncharacterized protein n=1 Tax=Lolium multiflorum TaxID=4521 RepID=A0AAD8X9I2_LOLMU|nr:hypothetical protein QYE76_015804 [Lolium multiflorum]
MNGDGGRGVSTRVAVDSTLDAAALAKVKADTTMPGEPLLQGDATIRGSPWRPWIRTRSWLPRRADEGDDDAGGDGGGDAERKQTPLTSALRDPHVQELLLKDTGNAKLEAKLAQMEVNHGFKGCVKCMDKTPHLQLPKPPGSCKTVFQGTRMWLRFDHPAKRSSEEPHDRGAAKKYPSFWKIGKSAPRRERSDRENRRC